MGYYVRVLSTSAASVPLPELRAALQEKNLRADLRVEDGTDSDWEQLVLSHPGGREIAAIERNLVEEDSLGAEELAEFAEELAEFAEEIAGCRPASAAQWLLEYLPRVRCIYAFQVLSGTEHGKGWDCLDAVKERLWAAAPGLLQADAEGFSNEEGYHILWQFDDDVDGDYWMGVLQDGRWEHFQMDLADPEQRAAFLEGQVPAGVTRK